MSSESKTLAGRRKTRAEVIRAVEALPPLPAVALRVVQVAQDPRSSAADLAMVVSSDPGLSAAVLRASNAAAYRRSSDVTSVRQALIVLGFERARNIAVSSAITSRYGPDALNALFRIDAFWRHSIAVAFKTAELAGKVQGLDVPTAFTAGILHNMGRLAMFYADPAAIDQAVAEAMRREEPFDEVERELLGYDHAEVGGLLAEKWSLPAEISEAIVDHHHAGAPDASLAGVVAAADRYCTAHGVLPGYIVPGRAEAEAPEAFVRLMEQVDELMMLITHDRVGLAPRRQ